jgi:hypothetical protein
LLEHLDDPRVKAAVDEMQAAFGHTPTYDLPQDIVDHIVALNNLQKAKQAHNEALLSFMKKIVN